MAGKDQTKKENSVGNFFEEAKDFLEYSERTMNSFSRLIAINQLQSAKLSKENFFTKAGHSIAAFTTKSETLIKSEKIEESASLYDQHKNLSDPLIQDRKLLKNGNKKDVEDLFEKYVTGSSKKKREFYRGKKYSISQKKHALRAMIDESLDNLDQYFIPRKNSLMKVKVIDETLKGFTKGDGFLKSMINSKRFLKGVVSNKALLNTLKNVGIFNDIIGITDVIDEIKNFGNEKNLCFKGIGAFKIIKNSVDFFKGVRQLTNTKFVRKLTFGAVETAEKTFLKNLPKIGRFMSKFGRVAKVFGPVGEVLSLGVDIADACKETDPKKRQIKVGAAIGGAAGAIAAGALVGSIIPGAGTLVGAAVGMLGYYAGRYIGEYLANPDTQKSFRDFGQKAATSVRKAFEWITKPKRLSKTIGFIGSFALGGPIGALMFGLNTIPLPKKDKNFEKKVKQDKTSTFIPWRDSFQFINSKPTKTMNIGPTSTQGKKKTKTSTQGSNGQKFKPYHIPLEFELINSQPTQSTKGSKKNQPSIRSSKENQPPIRSLKEPQASMLSPLNSNGFSLNHDEIFGVMVRGMNKVIQNTA